MEPYYIGNAQNILYRPVPLHPVERRLWSLTGQRSSQRGLSLQIISIAAFVNVVKSLLLLCPSPVQNPLYIATLLRCKWEKERDFRKPLNPSILFWPLIKHRPGRAALSSSMNPWFWCNRKPITCGECLGDALVIMSLTPSQNWAIF